MFPLGSVLYWSPSRIFFVVVQFKKDTGLSVSMLIFLNWLLVLTNVISAFICCDWGFLRISIFSWYSVAPSYLDLLNPYSQAIFKVILGLPDWCKNFFDWQDLEFITRIKILNQFTFFVWTFCVCRHFVYFIWLARLSELVGFGTVLTWLSHF